ncbi:MAG: universal stress protein [Cyclobacteriaceae bacterium]
MSESKYKRWMVGLDFSDIDPKVINRVSHLSRILKPDVINFVHVEKELDIPIYIPKELTNLVPTASEQYAEKMEEIVSKNFDNLDVTWHAKVVGGKTFDTLIKWVKDENIDFFIAGRKRYREGSGLLPHKLLRSLACPALFIPDMKMPGTKKILVAVDFSNHSLIALRTALKLAESGEISVDCLHIYSVPIGHYSTGKTYKEFVEIMRVNAMKEFQRFTKSLDPKPNLKCLILDKTSAAELIYDECKDGNYDLVIMGSKGQSAGSVMLLGSTAEKLIRMNRKCMSWIVKMKDEHIGFFKALSKI